MENNYQISQRNKSLVIDPVFSNWVNFNKKVSIINKLLYKFKDFKAIYSIAEGSWKNKSAFFPVSLRSLLFSNC